MLFVHHAHFQRGGATKYVLCLCGVLHARQLHNHPVRASLLNNRLGDTQFVDPVAQRRDVLLDGELLDALLNLGPQLGGDCKFGTRIGRSQQQIGYLLADLRRRLVPGLSVAELDDYVLSGAHKPRVAHFAPQLGADIRGVAISGLGQSTIHIHL